MSSIVSPAAVLSTPADDSAAWSRRFDEAQARWRASQRPITITKPVAEAPAAETDAEWFERFGAELDAVEARGGLLTKLVPAESFADDLLEACGECLDGRDDSDIPEPESDPSEWPEWTDGEVWGAEADPLSIEELLEGVPHYGEDGPARRATSDEVASAWWNGYQLGESGYEVEQVNPPQHMTGREATAFIEGVASGADDRWTAYGLWLEQQDALARMFDPFAEINEAELAACGCR